MFGTILLIIFTVMHIYVFWHIARLPFVKKRFSRKIIFLLCIVEPIAYQKREMISFQNL